MRKEVLIDFTEGEGEDKVEVKGKVIMKKLSWTEKNLYDEESTDIKIFGNTPKVEISLHKMKEAGARMGTVSSDLTLTTYNLDKVTGKLVPSIAPIDVRTKAGLDMLPIEVGEMLFLAFSEINNLDDKKKEH